MGEERERHTLTVYLDEEEYRFLKRVAFDADISMSQALRDLLRSFRLGRIRLVPSREEGSEDEGLTVGSGSRGLLGEGASRYEGREEDAPGRHLWHLLRQFTEEAVRVGLLDPAALEEQLRERRRELPDGDETVPEWIRRLVDEQTDSAGQG